jgi:hypothetical protein
MHTDPEPRHGFDSNRAQLTLAVTLAMAAVAGGLALGHHPSAEGALSAVAAIVPVAATRTAPDTAGDPSLPDASEAVGTAAAEPGEPAATF